MLMKKMVISTLFTAATIGAVAIPLQSLAEDDIVLKLGPPAAQVEPVPAAREGYVWSPGHYTWQSNNHVWVKGEWVASREGYSYKPNRWVEQDGRWNLERSRWDQTSK